MLLKKLFIILLLISPAICFSQGPGYKAFNLTEDNIFSKIFSLFKNNEGYLFAGSNNGLFKFDGNKFKKILTAKKAFADTVTAIFQDDKKQLWAGYQSGNIATMHNATLTYLEPEEGTPHKKITAFIQDNNKNIWFSTEGEGIYYFYNKRMYLITTEDGLSDKNVHTLAVASNGDILAATDNGLNICSVTGSKKKVIVIGPDKGLPDYIVTSISPAGNDNFWIGLQDKGICLYNNKTKQITVPPINGGWIGGQVNALHYSENKLWIATQDSGLMVYEPVKNSYRHVPVLSAPQKTINIITEDNQGNIWLTADNNTLIRTACNSIQLFPFYNEETSSSIHSILATGTDSYWAGYNTSLLKFTKTGNGIIARKFPIAGLGDKTDITSLYQDKYQNIWIGSMGMGVFVFNPSTGQSRQLKEAMTSGSTSILSITGSGNTICTAGLEGAMVFELTEDNKSILHPYTFTNYNNIENIGSTYIYSVFKDSRQRIWFATDGKGLTMLADGVFTHYNNNHGLKDNHIYAIAEDRKGNIWFSTSNAGIYRFDGKNFQNFSMQQGLSSLSVSALKTDRLGNIVAVHKDGLDIINTATGNFSYINSAQNIPLINDDLGAICTDSAGNIFVSTKKGILEYAAVQSADNTPKTILESVQLFLTDIDTSALHHFKYDENNITFNFTGLYYSDPGNIFYRYKLEGFDTLWQLTNDVSKSFPKLTPGTYHFRVQSSLNKNFNNVSEAGFEFLIDKPIWRKWWFVLSYLIVAGGLLYWYIKKRETQLKQVERLQNEKIKFEFEVLRNQVNPHFLFNSFNTLISTIEEDPKMAVEYVEQLSDFFRNIVTYKDIDIISIKEEKGLLRSYLYMQQKRYGNSVQLETHLTDQEKSAWFVPPLTLQLLVENAIKHNVVSKESKLIISLQMKNNYLVVQNNITKKNIGEKGTGMGLVNIVNRYALLTATPVLVDNDGKYFTVSLPILKS